MKKTILHLAHTTLVSNRNVASRARFWAALCLACLLTTAIHPARAGVIEAWVQRYNGPAKLTDYGSAVAVDRSGNVVVTGVSVIGTLPFGEEVYALYTAKYAAATGALLWEKSGKAGWIPFINALAMDGSGNVVVMGSTYNGTNSDYYTAKYAAADGALLWDHPYNGPADSDDYAYAVAVDGSGNVVVTGASYSTNYHRNSYTAKYAAADGALLWEAHYNDQTNIFNEAQAVTVDAGGNVVVTGYSGNVTNIDYYTAKYAAADGALLWDKRYDGPANSTDDALAVAVDGSGNVAVTGFSYNGTNFDYYTAKYAAANGALLWERRSHCPATNINNFASAVAVDGSGNVVLAGYSYNNPNYGGTNADHYAAKYAASDGMILWEKRSIGPANGSTQAYPLAVDSSGDVVVTGSSDGDYYTAKYAAADGALLWEKRYDGPANGDDFALALAVGPNGMVAVTGASSGDYATVVYWENLPPVAIAPVPTGIRLRFAGVPGRSYNIERAPAVTGPWSPLATPTAPPGGLIEYVDTTAPAASAFYRTSTP